MFLNNAEALYKLFTRNNNFNVLLNEKDRNEFNDIINGLPEERCSNSLQTFLALQEDYSIEIIWRLHTKQIIDFSEFVTRCKWDPNHFVEGLLLMSISNDILSQTILTDLLKSLLLLSLGVSNDRFDKHKQIIKHFLTQSSSVILKDETAWIYLEKLNCSPILKISIIRKIFKVMLRNMLLADIDFHLDNAYEQYRLHTTSNSVFDMLKMFLDEIDENDIVSLIYNVVLTHTENANWKLILSLVSTFIKIKPQKSRRLKSKLEDQFTQALDRTTTATDFLMCKASLLIFRHCCLEIGLWAEYSRWYTSYKLNVNNTKVFYFLLIELLPVDLPAALAAHLNNQPEVTETCVGLQNEYVKKAKAQLTKINKGQDFMGLFKDYDDSQNRHEADVAKVLESFKSTGEVMRVVLEAFVFRNKYFVDTFLKTLMDSRLVDDKLRADFIEKLNSMNKIPKNLYNKWKQEQNIVNLL